MPSDLGKTRIARRLERDAAKEENRTKWCRDHVEGLPGPRQRSVTHASGSPRCWGTSATRSLVSQVRNEVARRGIHMLRDFRA